MKIDISNTQAITPSSSKSPELAVTDKLEILKQQVGKLLQAEITGIKLVKSIQSKSLLSVNTSFDNQLGSSKSQSLPGNNLNLYQKILGNSQSESVHPQLKHLWQIKLSIPSINKPLLTELISHQLPKELAIGKFVQFEVAPKIGLVFVPTATKEPNGIQQQANINQALARWINVQGPVKKQLNTLIQWAESNRQVPAESKLNSQFQHVFSHQHAGASSKSPVSLEAFPEKAVRILEQVKAGIIQSKDIQNISALRSALINSGSQFEHQMLNQLDKTDLKKLLSQNQNTGSTSSSNAISPNDSAIFKLLPADLKGQLISALSQLLANPSNSSETNELPQNWKNLISWLATNLPAKTGIQNPLEFPTRQVADRPISNIDAGEILRALVQALSRIQVNQLNSLQQTFSQTGDTQTQVWLLELPVMNQQVDLVQMRLEKESHKNAKDCSAKSVWKLVLAFDFDTLGPMQSHVNYADGTVSAVFWAEQQNTLSKLNHEMTNLRQSLTDWGLHVGSLDVKKGHPPPPSTPISWQLLDERV